MKSKISKYPPLIFNIYKPSGPSSFSIVSYFKRNLPQEFGKIGHFGTLDPFASGVLLIGTGGATKVNNFIHDLLPKTYLATGVLGVETPTGDLTEEPSKTVSLEETKTYLSEFSEESLSAFFQEKFLGDYLQVPPTFSATKYKGRPLYKYAREGVEIKKDPVLRNIYSLKIIQMNFPEITFEVRVSTGTYIRTLFQDMAKSLGTIGTLRTLERTSIGPFNLKNSLLEKEWPLKGMNSNGGPFVMEEIGFSLDEALSFPSKIVSSDKLENYLNGMPLKVENFSLRLEGNLMENLTWVYADEKTLIGLGKVEEGVIRPIFNLPRNQIFYSR